MSLDQPSAGSRLQRCTAPRSYWELLIPPIFLKVYYPLFLYLCSAAAPAGYSRAQKFTKMQFYARGLSVCRANRRMRPLIPTTREASTAVHCVIALFELFRLKAESDLLLIKRICSNKAGQVPQHQFIASGAKKSAQTTIDMQI